MHRLEIEKSKTIRLEHATKEQKATTDKQKSKMEEELSKAKIHFNHQSTLEQNRNQSVLIALGENVLLLRLLLLVGTGIALTFSLLCGCCSCFLFSFAICCRKNQNPKRPKRSRQEHFENQMGRGRARCFASQTPMCPAGTKCPGVATAKHAIQARGGNVENGDGNEIRICHQ